jgi:hypothetical protein
VDSVEWAGRKVVLAAPVMLPDSWLSMNNRVVAGLHSGVIDAGHTLCIVQRNALPGLLLLDKLSPPVVIVLPINSVVIQ